MSKDVVLANDFDYVKGMKYPGLFGTTEGLQWKALVEDKTAVVASLVFKDLWCASTLTAAS